MTTPTLNLSTCRPLRTYPVGHSNYNPTIVEAILASMANPSWFDPVTIGSSYLQETLVGGAIGFNNPTREGLEEAKRAFGPEQPVAVIISFGSGQHGIPSLRSSTKEELDAALEKMAMDCEKVSEEMSQRLTNTSIYYRFSVDKGIEDVKITDWDDSFLGMINGRTKDYNSRISSSLDMVVDLLLKPGGSMTLEQISTF